MASGTNPAFYHIDECLPMGGAFNVRTANRAELGVTSVVRPALESRAQACPSRNSHLAGASGP
eukprot:6205703-Pleurochrysis_carterae.AAC.1